MRPHLLLLLLLIAGNMFGQPVINSIAPTSGPVGTPVTITGTGFSTTPANNIVYFGAVKATVSTASNTTLTVSVPAGASWQPVSVTTNNLIAFSAQPFTVTFPASDPHLTTSSFSIAGNYATGTYPRDVIISDLNVDGKPDLVTLNAVGNSISVIKNTSTSGSLSFDAKVDYSTGNHPLRVLASDLDGDGMQDIIVVNFNAGGPSTISIYRNTSTGATISLANPIAYATGDGSVGISIADLNKDGRLDLVVCSGNSGWFSTFLNSTTSPGTITFSPKQDHILLMHPDNTHAADLDSDGLPDIITSNFSNNKISVFKNISTGGSLFLTTKTDYAVGTNPTYVTSGDLNGDTKPDLVISNYSAGTSSFYKNLSTSDISLGTEFVQPFSTTNICIADINGDGKPDLCIGRNLTGLMSIVENTYNDTGDFAFGTAVDFAVSPYDTYVAVGDLDGDGKPELVSVNTTADNLTVLKNIIDEPKISSASLVNAVSGSPVTLNGSNLSGATAVKFGGTPAASFNVVSSTRIDAIVGGGASGSITVTTPLGTATIAGFRFTPEVTAGGPVTFCNEESVVLTSTAIANNQWYKDGNLITGATAKTYQASSSGVYTVKTTSNGITTTSAAGVNVTATVIPTPSISFTGGNLVSSASAGNQWYLEGNLIAGATNQIYQPLQTGNYTVRSTVNNCVSNASASFNFVITGLVNIGNGQFINFYPVPVQKMLNVNWNISGAPSLDITVVDIHGKEVSVNKNLHNGSAIDLSSLPGGVYFVRIYNKQLKLNQKLKIVKGD